MRTTMHPYTFLITYLLCLVLRFQMIVTFISKARRAVDLNIEQYVTLAKTSNIVQKHKIALFRKCKKRINSYNAICCFSLEVQVSI